jgi:flagellin
MQTSAIGGIAAATGNVDVNTLFTTGDTPAVAAVWTTADLTSDFTGGGAISFTVGGQAVTLNADYSLDADATNVAAAIDGQLDATVNVTFSGDTVIFTAATAGAAGDAAVAVAGTDAGTVGGSATTAGADLIAGTPQAYAPTDLSVQVGDAAAVSLAGSYDSVDELLAGLNSVAGVYATVDETTGFLSITSAEDLVITGTNAADVGLTASTTPVAASGNLSTVTVLDADAANDAIQRIDSALTSVSDLRSTLGAIQNRFQSTINSLQAVSENLSASRSRILDTDFAAETAALTRAQILQQAGTAMVAQANSIPQNVLSLLR